MNLKATTKKTIILILLNKLCMVKQPAVPQLPYRKHKPLDFPLIL